jgi:hypothetical protein
MERASSVDPGRPVAVETAKPFVGMGVRRQESYTEGTQPPPLRPITQLRVRDSHRRERPLSMIESRSSDSNGGGNGGGGGSHGGGVKPAVSGGVGGASPGGAQLFHPVQDELRRKDTVIQNLTESQKTLNSHNQQLLGKVDELEFLNSRLKDILDRHGIAYDDSTFMKLHNPAASHNPPSSSSSSSSSSSHLHSAQHSTPPPVSSKPQRSQSLLAYGDVIRMTHDHSNPVSSFKPTLTPTPASPNNESVSGYGSLASCGDNAADTSVLGSSGRDLLKDSSKHRITAPRTAGLGDYDDDDDDDDEEEVQLLAEIRKGGSLDSNRDRLGDTLAKSSSSGGEDSRGQIMNKDSDMESVRIYM